SLLPLLQRRTKPAALPKSAERSRPRRAPVGWRLPAGLEFGTACVPGQLRRQVAAVQRPGFNRRSATRDHNTPRPWTEFHGYHHGLAPRGEEIPAAAKAYSQPSAPDENFPELRSRFSA